MVYPNRMLGQQLLDAGIVQFAPGSQLDVQKSMGVSPKDGEEGWDQFQKFQEGLI